MPAPAGSLQPAALAKMDRVGQDGPIPPELAALAKMDRVGRDGPIPPEQSSSCDDIIKLCAPDAYLEHREGGWKITKNQPHSLLPS